ncbi:hypothetical protein QCA50_005439 [Cerrena zonata]|uniref:Uncharacterized protein n=1 Tax=Cerrena zonata TaxID=2478898 RepID=A0AAW0GR48_9APHY
MSLNTAVSEKPFRFCVYVPFDSYAQPVTIDVPRDAAVGDLWLAVCNDVRLKGHVDGSLQFYKYDQIVPPADHFRAVTTWLNSKTDEDTLESMYPLMRYFPQGPLTEDDAIDIVAVSEKPFRFCVYAPYDPDAQPVTIDVPRDATVEDLWWAIYHDVRLQSHVDASLKLYKYNKILLPEIYFESTSDWLRTQTSQNMLQNKYPLMRYFPQGPLAEDDAIDTVAVTEPKSVSRKRPRLDGDSTFASDSRARLLHPGDSQPQDQEIFAIYNFLWKNEGNWDRIVDPVTENVPNLASSVLVASDPGSLEQVEARFIDLARIPSFENKTSLCLSKLRFLIREEYVELDEGIASNEESVLVLGQPGIGKSLYLTYCLLRRLVAGKTTIFSLTPTLHDVKEDDKNGLVLYDINPAQPNANGFFALVALADYCGIVTESQARPEEEEGARHCFQGSIPLLVDKSGTASLAGILFEQMAHQYIFNKRASPYHLTLLSSPSAQTSTDLFVDLSHIDDIYYFNKFASFSEFIPSYYYRPSSSNFPGIDSFAFEVNAQGQIVGMVAFQFTISSSHPIDVRFFKEMRKLESEVFSFFKFVFVVPKGKKSIRHQLIKPESDCKVWTDRVHRYVLDIDPDALWD